MSRLVQIEDNIWVNTREVTAVKQEGRFTIVVTPERTYASTWPHDQILRAVAARRSIRLVDTTMRERIRIAQGAPAPAAPSDDNGMANALVTLALLEGMRGGNSHEASPTSESSSCPEPSPDVSAAPDFSTCGSDSSSGGSDFSTGGGDSGSSGFDTGGGF